MDNRLDLRIGAVSDPGLVRRENEDALGYELPSDIYLQQTRGALFVVCDGIGGLQGGQYASRLAVDSFLKAYYSGKTDMPDALLRKAAALANDLVYQDSRGRGWNARMGTTIVAVVIQMANLWVLNIGDSRAYLWRRGTLQQLSRDHAPADRRMSEDRRIDRALGTDPQVKPYIRGPIPLGPGDRVLLCTDGLTTAVPELTIAATIRDFPAPQAARQLIEQAKTAGARDNVSVLVVNLSGRTEPASKRPAWDRNHFDGILKSLGTTLRSLSWTDLDPLRLLMTQGWRSVRGAAILFMWLALALVFGLVLGWFVGK